MSRVILRSALERLRLAGTVQMLLAEGTNGRLEVHTPDSSGWLLLAGGGFLDARLEHLSGPAAVVALLMCRSGECAMIEEEVPDTTGTPMEPFGLLVESLRVQDHWTAIARRTLRCLQPDAPDASSTGPERRFVRALLEGVSVAEAAAAAGLHPVEAIPLVEAMLSTGRWTQGGLRPESAAPPWITTNGSRLSLEALEAPPNAAETPPDASRRGPDTPSASDKRTFALLMEQGMKAYRARQLDAAEDFWRRAAELCPDDRRLQVNFRVLSSQKKHRIEGGA